MEIHYSQSYFERRPILKSKAPAVKWVKKWSSIIAGRVPQDLVTTGGKCMLLRWVTEDTLKALKEKEKEIPVPEPEPEPTTEVLFLCSYDGCGKTFIDAGALRKHSHIHGERQYVCHYEGCGKKFLDSSKLKRHFLIHTGERDFVCPYEGCGKAFSLDFNLRSHMKTHSQENYHICPYPDCGKRFAHEYKLKNHMASHHEKVGQCFLYLNASVEVIKYTPPSDKQTKTKPSGGAYGSASSDRPYACPYEGCEKAYIHEYKLRLHLKREHPGHMADENAEHAQVNADNEMDEASDQDAYGGKWSNGKTQKQSRPKPNLKLPHSKIAKRKGSTATLTVINKPLPVKDETFDEEDSEETEEDRNNVEDGWRYAGGNNEDDDEETEYED
ncbi:Zinc finger C2H2-type [Sesbania bispinosa]|nr:Zinc finger C2H2-type [Sesbania bispinosa]